MAPTYKRLKKLFRRDKAEFVSLIEEVGREEMIAVLASAEFDGEWPLGLLKAFDPQLARGLTCWTAGGYEEIRKAQETGKIKAGTAAFDLAESFHRLPIWHGPITHASKDKSWFTRLPAGETLVLKSFMGCCAKGHSFGYATTPAATLSFTKLKSARLVGALSKENMEREVLLPDGARFSVVSVDLSSRFIHLVQEGAT